MQTHNVIASLSFGINFLEETVEKNPILTNSEKKIPKRLKKEKSKRKSHTFS